MYSRITILFLFLLSLTMGLPPSVPAQGDDIAAHRECKHCGMDRKAYGYSRMLVRYADGTETGVCSLRCVVVDLEANKERTTDKILVADRDSQILIPADTAVWVMGGNKRGVMTQRPKWAFSTDKAARAFIAANGGDIVTWEQAQAAARDDLKPHHKHQHGR